nr:MAG TPA: hypothetical protein [Caudoviricetes sp.]
MFRRWLLAKMKIYLCENFPSTCTPSKNTWNKLR